MLLESIAAKPPGAGLAGKTAVITGAASGIGLALAGRLKAERMRVVLVDADAEALTAASERLDAKGFTADTRDASAMQALARDVAGTCGPVHLLCANAGVSRMAGIKRLSPEDWRWLFDVNLFGAVHTVTAFLPVLAANPDGGQLLITASLSSLYATRAQAAYAATKYALAAFAETLALELDAEGSKVAVSLLCPGPVRTNLGASYARRGAEYRAAAPAAEAEPDIHERAFRAQVEPGDWSTPDEIADLAVEGLKRGEFWIITHPQLMGAVEARHRAIAEAVARARP